MDMTVFYSTAWIFMIFSVVGWILDTLSASLDKGGMVNRGLLVGPVCPMYGFLCSGAYLLNLYVCKDVPFVQLVFFTIFATVSIFAVNAFFKKFFKITFWNFSETPMNYKEYISFSGALAWGIILLVVTSFTDEFIVNLIAEELPNWVNFIVVITFFSILFCDFIFSILMMLGLNKRAKSFENVLSGVRNIENKAGRAIEKSAEKSGLELKLLKIRLFFQDVFGRITLYLKRLKDKIILSISKDTIFTRRIKSAYESIVTSDGVEKIQKDAQNHWELNMKAYESSLPDTAEKPFAYGINICKLFLLFVIGSIIGCFIETCFALIVEGHFEIRVGLVYGPFIPIYGLGAVLLTLALSRFYKSSFIALFAISGTVGATFEYFCSWVQEMVFGTISWDYSHMPFNIDGRTCLSYALMWGALGVVWVRELYPLFSRLIEKIPTKIGYIITLVFVVFMLFNVFISSMAQLRAAERDEGKLATNAFAEYLDEKFNDEYLELIYPNMRKVE